MRDKMSEIKKENPLEMLPINKLLVKFSVPSIIAMLVTALYNIVDQFFIGQAVGSLGNAATSISFPLSITCIAIALLFGIGGASAFNLSMGAGDKKKAAYYIGNAAAMLFLCGLVLCIVSEMFLKPMLLFFGSSDNVLPYAMTYTRITAIGFPLVILTAGGGHLIRADGNPNMAMICNLIGAVINTVLDAIFVFGLHLRKLLAADNINIPYGNRKTKGRYVFISYKTDNLFTSISYCAAAYHGNRRNNVCRTNSGRTCSSRSYCYDKNRIFERGI